MKNKQYFPLEVNIMNSPNVSKLTEKYRSKGFGIYITVLIELCHSHDYRCDISVIHGIARRDKISKEIITCVLYDFNLFEFSEKEGREFVSSPYLDRVMDAYNERVAKLVKAGTKRSDNATRKSNGQFTSNAGALDKIRLDKIR